MNNFSKDIIERIKKHSIIKVCCICYQKETKNLFSTDMKLLKCKQSICVKFAKKLKNCRSLIFYIFVAIRIFLYR